MKLERKLQIGIAAQVALGSLLLGMGQRDFRLALAALVAAAVSLHVTDRQKWIRLNRLPANLAALGAVAVSAADFMRYDSESQLLAIANLLIYLQIVLLFQEKTPRLYWHLIVLSLLQVVVGAALNLGLMFGLLLVVYLLLTLTNLIIFCVHRELLRFEAHPAGPPAANSANRSPNSIVVQNAPAEFSARLLNSALTRQVTRIGLGTLVVAAVVFFAVPRLGRPAWRPFGQGTRRVVGYSTQVRLGALGAAFQNPELVMHVEFRDQYSGVPYPLQSDPLFRGSLLNHYQDGEWGFRGPRLAGGSQPLGPGPGQTDLVLQRTVLEPLSEPVLFLVYPPFKADPSRPDHEINYDPYRQLWLRADNVQPTRFEFETLTSGLILGAQAAIVPDSYARPLDDERRRQLLTLPAADERGDPLASLKEAAERELRAAPGAAGNRIAEADVLKRYLQSSRFSYSLDAVPRNRALDPIEDFIREHPRGHCEFFASALTLMLRSRQIPARMVVGFKGGDYNTLGSYYQVRQLHAHTWVEAYLEPDQVPEADRAEGGAAGAGAWLILDPTPASEASSLFADGNLLDTVGDFADYLELLWNTYVIGMNADRQRDAVYRPLASMERSAAEIFRSPAELVEEGVSSIGKWLADNWLSWRGAVALALMVGSTVGLIRSVRGLARIWRSDSPGWKRVARRRPAEVEFFIRFERLLARHGILRAASQTPLELARVAAAELAASAEHHRVGGVPRRIVEAFYRVRFGRLALDRQEMEAVEHGLEEISHALGARRENAGG